MANPWARRPGTPRAEKGAAPEPRQQNAVIDIHCHGAGLGFGGSDCFISPEMRRNWRFRVFLNAFGVTVGQLAAEGDRAVFRMLSSAVTRSTHVDAAVVLALDAAVDERGEMDRQRTHLYLPNDFVAQMARDYAGLLFGASVNPRRRDALAALDQAAAWGAVLVKWLPPVQQIVPADRRNVPFYEKLAALGLPLLIHTGSEHAFPGAEQSLGALVHLRLPLEVGVTVIAAHCGMSAGRRWNRSARELATLMRKYPNLYADISSLTQGNRVGALPALLRIDVIRPRLLYGTDMPVLRTPAAGPGYFFWKLPSRQLRALRRIDNPWDQDVALKRALGLPVESLATGARVLAPRLEAPGKKSGSADGGTATAEGSEV